MTRKKKRLQKENTSLFADVWKILHHYFPKLYSLLNSVEDPRHQSYITYHTAELLMTRIFGYCCFTDSMRDMTTTFNNTNVIRNMRCLFQRELEELPHGDTITNFLKEVSIDELRKVMKYMVKALLAMKVVTPYKVERVYHPIVIDGTQLYSFPMAHTEGCLTTKHNDESMSYHTNVVLAVMVLGNIVIPVDFESIENVGILYNKQDCELQATKRLLEKIKKTYPRLPICIGADALYANKTILEMCKKHKWKYIINYKKGSIPSIEEDRQYEYY